MNRKEFLYKSSAAVLGVGILPSLLGCASTQKIYDALPVNAGNFARVRNNVFRYTNKGGTVGIYETKECFVVVDAQFPDSIQPVLDEMGKKGKPIEFLCNTHHHADHTAGNFAFKNKVKSIVAHAAVPALQRRDASEKNNLGKEVFANVLFENKHTLDLGKEKIKAYHYGAGHTKGDSIYHFENENVVHVGDLVFINMIPVYRLKDGANSVGWINSLDKIINQFDSDTLFIFGHTPKPDLTVGKKAELIEMKNFLESTNEWVAKAIKEGKTTEELLKANQFVPGFAHRTTPQRFPDFVKSIRETLTK